MAAWEAARQRGAWVSGYVLARRDHVGCGPADGGLV
jgi:hypothetical protein